MSYGPICLILTCIIVMTNGAVRLTNIKCTTYDSAFATFEKCDLKVLRRGVIALNIYAKLHQLPLANVSINVSLNKKANGYRPFLYNVSADFCESIKFRSRYPHLKILFDALLKDSNINHTCPYDHDIIIRNLVLTEELFRFAPLPEGEYAIYSKVSTYSELKVDLKTYFIVKGDFSFNRKGKSFKLHSDPKAH